MRDDDNRKSRRGSVWLPATVLFLLLSLVSGAVYWLTLPEMGEHGDQPDAKQIAPKKAGADHEPTNLAETKAKDLAPSQIGKLPDLPRQTVKEAHKGAPGLPKMAATQQTLPQTAAPAERLADPEGTKTELPTAKRSPNPAPLTVPAAVPVSPPPVPLPPAAPASRERDTAHAPPVRLSLPNLPPPPPSAPLPRAPDPVLVENSPKGPLPVVGRDGREAWQVYARPFDPLDKRPRISVVFYGLGTSGAATRTAIQGMPGAITLAFSPYADALGNWIADARAAGHEVLLMVPMEPRNYPDYDPGPQALLTSLSEPENTERLEWILGRGVGYVGVTDFMGSRFTNSTPHMRALFRHLKKRGLMFLESSITARAISGGLAAAGKVPYASNALYIDSQASRSAIDGQLAEAERLAKQLGAVVVMGFPYPVTLERIANWAATVEKRGFALAPVSAIAKRRN